MKPALFVTVHRTALVVGLLQLAVFGMAAAAPGTAKPAARKAGKPIARKSDSPEVAVTTLPVAQVRGQHRLATVTIDGQQYAKAVQLANFIFAGNQFIDYNIGKRFQRFRSLVGISDNARTEFALVYVVYGDGQELYRSKLMRVGDAPERVDIDVTGVLRLRLEVEEGGEDRLVDYGPQNAFWVNPRLVREGVIARPTEVKIILNGNPLVTQAPIVKGEPHIPISLLRKLGSSLQNIEWHPERGEVLITTR